MNININGYNINYEVAGQGKPVVLVHGWLANLETMKPLQNYLSKYFKVYNLDVIGFGKSDLPKEPMSTEDLANFLNDFLDALNIENPILIGHSNGGRMIINLAGRNLRKINKIVLMDSAGIVPKRKPKYYFKVYSFKFVKNITKLFPNTEMFRNMRERMLGKFGSSDYKNSPEVLRKTMSIILNEDQKSVMPNIKVPTLIIWGEDDNDTPIEDAKTMEKLIPDSGLVTYKGRGHFAYLEELGSVLAVLDEFFKNDK